MHILPKKKENKKKKMPHKQISRLSGKHRTQDYMETQLYKNKLNYLMLPFASQVKKGYRIKHFKLFVDRNLLHN